MITTGYKLVLENLYMPESGTSRHVMICISGFLSEKCSFETSWRYLVDECRKSGTPLYTVRWEASDTSVLENNTMDAA